VWVQAISVASKTPAFKNQVEKKTARRAFDKAFARHCSRITAEARRMLENVTAPSDVWRVEEYLSDHRRTVDAIYDYPYSRLRMVFSMLMRDGWLAEADLSGLRPDGLNTLSRRDT
jgi:hypothetical protein